MLVATSAHASGLLSMSGRTIDDVIADHLAKAEHDNRDIPDSALSAAHRLALDAYEAGRVSVEEMPGRAALDAAAADYAEFVLIHLNRYEGLPGRKILARNDFLLRDPVPGRRYTKCCPHCGRPTVYQESHPRAVCGHCVKRTTDRAGRRVTGFNVSLSGGMIAYYADTVDPTDGSGAEYVECVEVTRTGLCFIDGRRASMHESRFGGIVVQLEGDDRLRPPAT
ncbi:zinc ribbon domain-containing protein [Nocardia cyriacigeorgica]|uniref:zinc ribbon domain-containing protein n=1 Tax=Nocardia cyriacigeorgica TaxID=135487 RepID=UPI001E38DFE2|nr:zinc ribbon domain-containing protein [Nocardia cyriacigeorgica]